MDAHAHLLSLGWAGPGHSLDSRPYKQKGHRGLAFDPSKVGNNGTGLVKPLLVSQRRGRLGVGKKAHEPQAGNEWWLKGFESALGNIGKSESERSSGTATPVAHEYAGKHGGLYSFFVRGQEMEGTIGTLEEIKQPSKKRKSDALEQEKDDDTVPSARSKQQKTAADFEQVGAYIAVRDKDEKRAQRMQKLGPVEEFRQVSEYLEARSQEKTTKKRKSEASPSWDDTPVVDGETNEPERVETKEERRERRRRRRDEREKRKARAGQDDEPPVSAEVASEDAAARAARRAERKGKRKKAEKAARSAKGS